MITVARKLNSHLLSHFDYSPHRGGVDGECMCVCVCVWGGGGWPGKRTEVQTQFTAGIRQLHQTPLEQEQKLPLQGVISRSGVSILALVRASLLASREAVEWKINREFAC